jgi:cytoskeleton protein RodZ
MAASVGQTLRKARAERKIELSEVEEVTKIRVKFLLAMEQDEWDDLPGPAYARSFLASYARLLGLDEAALVEQYRGEVEKGDRVEPLPAVIKPGSISRPTSARPAVLVVAGLVAVVALGLVIAAALGGSDGDDGADRHAAKDASPTPAATAEPTTTTGAVSATDVSLELRATADVWVCLVDERGRPEVAGETLASGEARGPFEGPGFEVTLGNGSVELSVDGEPARVPPLAEPLAYRITPDGADRVDAASGPDCV